MNTTRKLYRFSFLSFCLALFYIVSGCSGTKNILTDSRTAFGKNKEERLAFTAPQYSVVAFRPDKYDDTFDKESLTEQKAELGKLVAFLGGYVTTDCPVFTLEDLEGFVAYIGKNTAGKHKKTQGYVRFVNEEGTFYIDTQPEKRKEAYGIIISDGTRPPKIIWGTKGYLNQVKKWFGIKSYEALQQKIAERKTYTPTQQAQREADALTAEALTKAKKAGGVAEDKIDRPTTAGFARNFLRQSYNAEWMFLSVDKKGVRKQTAYSTGWRGEKDTMVVWYDRYGFPEKEKSTMGWSNKVEYSRDKNGLITQRTTFERDEDGRYKVAWVRRYRYEKEKVTEYTKGKTGLWRVATIYWLDDQTRIVKKQDVDEDGEITRTEQYTYKEHTGKLLQKRIDAPGAYRHDSHYDYDEKGRQIKEYTKMEQDGKLSIWDQTFVYDDDERKRTITTISDGETSYSTALYDRNGQVTWYAIESDGQTITSEIKYEYYEEE